MSEPLENKPSDTLEQRVTTTHRKAVIIVGAITLSVLLNLGLGLLILGRAGSSPRGDLRLPLYGAAAFLALTAIAIRRVLLLRFRLSDIAEKRGPGGILKHLYSVTLICAGLGSAIAMMGLLMVLFGGDQADLIRVSVVAAVIVLYSYPRLSTWKQAVAYFSAIRQGV